MLFTPPLRRYANRVEIGYEACAALYGADSRLPRANVWRPWSRAGTENGC